MFQLQLGTLFLILITTWSCVLVYVQILMSKFVSYQDGKRSTHKARSTDELTFVDIDMSYPDHLDRNFVDDLDMISLTVSRLSPEILDWFQSNKSLKFEASLVVSHCDKPVGWIFDDFIPKGFEFKNVTIYTKCGNDVIGAPENTTIIKLPNIGRCDHTYAHHLNQLNTTGLSKDHILVFLKDNNYQITEDAISMSELLQTAYINGFSCIKSWHPQENLIIKQCPKYSSYFLTASLKTTVIPVPYNREKRDDVTNFFSDYQNLGHFLETVNLTLPVPITPVCFGGQFATTLSQIEKLKPKWGDLENGLTRGNNIEESHFAERMWAGLLSKSISPMTIMKLFHRLKAIHVNNPIDQSGTLELFCPENKKTYKLRKKNRNKDRPKVKKRKN